MSVFTKLAAAAEKVKTFGNTLTNAAPTAPTATQPTALSKINAEKAAEKKAAAESAVTRNIYAQPSQAPKVQEVATSQMVTAPDAPVLRNIYAQPSQAPKVQEVATSQIIQAPTPTLDQQGAAALGDEWYSGVKDVNKSMVDGSIMNPYAVANKEAQLRSEKNARALGASQISAAGFSGSPTGSMYGNAIESQLAQSRFDNHLGIEQARNDMKMKGAEQAMNWADNANRFGLDQDRFAHDKDRFEKTHGLDQDRFAHDKDRFEKTHGLDQDRFAHTSALENARNTREGEQHDFNMESGRYALDTLQHEQSGTNFAKHLEGRPDLINNIARSDDATANQLVGSMRSDPAFNKAMQDLWERSGGTGEYPDEWALKEIKNWHSATDPTEIAIREIQSQTGLSREDAALLHNENHLKAYGRKIDSDGQLVEATEEETKEAIQTEVAGLQDKTIAFESYIFDGADDPVYQELLKQTHTSLENNHHSRNNNPGYIAIDAFEKALESKSPVAVDGALYRVVGERRVDGRDHATDYKIYTLIDPLTGEAKEYRTEQKASDKKGKHIGRVIGEQGWV